jgi:hypothetical protein
MRFFALQRFRPGRSTCAAGFTCPLWSVLRVWPPSRRLAPGPTLPALFQTGCAPGLHPSEVAHACGGTAFLTLRTDVVVRACPLVRASTSGRQGLPPLGFTPQECPSPDGGCYPVTRLAPLLGFSSLGSVLRPARLALQQTSAHWLVRPPVTRKSGLPLGVLPPTNRPDPLNPPAKAGKHPILRSGADQETPVRFVHLFMTLLLKAVRTDWPDF